ncbi:cyclin-like protein [Syncephalis fuscata]|nr:cyclin-like protein [Syncephalis fuscata]
MYVAEYAKDIIKYMLELEKKYHPDPNYMSRQTQLEWHMRTQLIDWMVEVHHKLELLPETLFLSVNILDRFLSKKNASIQRLQLVGAGSLILACKYEERCVPAFSTFAELSGNTLTVEDLKSSERYIASILGYEFGWPSPLNFIRQLSIVDSLDKEIRAMAKYLLEVALLDHRFLLVSTSTLAASAYYLARGILGKQEWTKNHAKASGFEVRQLYNTSFTLVHSLFKSQPDCRQVFHKYAKRENLRVSLVADYWLSLHGSKMLKSIGLDVSV